MLQRLTTLLTIALLATTTLAGSALHAGGHSCPMRAAMDCCASEQSAAGEAAPEVKAARLICALNCQQPAPTAPGFKVSQPQPSQVQPQAFTTGVTTTPPQPPAARTPSTHARAPGSPPAYIQHLALLI